MNIRKCKDGNYRLRLYHAHEDQIETIQLALEVARIEYVMAELNSPATN